MTEFLTENARRAYPLYHEWPGYSLDDNTVTVPAAWSSVLVDACIGYARVMEEDESILLKQVKCSASSATLRLYVNEDATVDVTMASGTGGTVYARNGSSDDDATVKAILAVNATALSEAISATKKNTWIRVDLPFAMKCVNSANRRVTGVSGYSPTECTTPVFAGSESPTVTADGDVTIVAKDGIDAETVTMLPLDGEVLRLSAISAPKDTTEDDTYEDLTLDGDDCFTVETLPGVKVVVCDDGKLDIEQRTAADTGGILHGGVIRIGTKCKPCCQCEDYENAFNALKPANDDIVELKKTLDAAKKTYEDAVEAFRLAKIQAEADINSYANVQVSAAATASGGVYSGVTKASGLRKRVAVTMTVTNMTLKNAEINAVGTSLFTVPGYTPVSMTWQTAGSTKAYGTALPTSTPQWLLKPGDTLVAVGTYALSGNTNDADVPTGTQAEVSVKLPGLEAASKKAIVR